MEEMANQAEESNVEELDYFLPDDYEENKAEYDGEEEEETPEEVEAEEVETETEEEQPKEEEEETTIESLSDLEVKYLHETKKLGDIPKDELQTYVQKGMNHDRLQDKLTIASEENNDFKELAQMFDMDVKQLTETLKQQYFEDKATKESRNAKDVKAEYESSHKNSLAKMVDRFAEKFPDTPLDSLPQEVMEAVKSGEDLVSAFNKFNLEGDVSTKAKEITALNDRIQALEKELKIDKQNTKVKKKGVVKSAQGSDDSNTDEFLSGFLG